MTLQDSKKKGLCWLALTIITVLALLSVLELVHPYYFLCDDNLDSYIAVYKHTVDAALDGELATYNFHQFMGIQFLSHGQTGTFNPITYISYGLSFLFLGHVYGMIDFVAIFHLLAGSIGTFFLIRKIKCSGFSAYLGAVCWALNSFTIYLGRAWLVVIIVAGFLPYIILFTLRFIEKTDGRSFLLTTLWKAYFFYCVGQPQFFAYAIIVDCIFALSYSFVFHKERLKKIILLYVLSSVAVIFLCLPLLMPMYREIALSNNRAGSYSFSDMLDGKAILISIFVAMFYPFIPCGPTHSFTLFSDHAGHIGYVLAFAIIFGLFSLRHEKKCNEKLYSKQILLALFPPVLITLLYGCSRAFLWIMSFVPVINQFRWPIKILEYFYLFLIMMASVLLDATLRQYFPDVKTAPSKKKWALTVLIVINILKFAGLYYLFPPQLRGLNNSAAIPFEEDGVDVIGDERYVSVFLTYGDCTPFDHNSAMAYNLATVYGIDSYLGYDSLIPTSFFDRDQQLTMTYAGILYRFPESTFQAFRSCGVRWYVVYDGDERYMIEDEKPLFIQAKQVLEANGCQVMHRSKDRLFYYDAAAPSVINCGGKDIHYKIYGNYYRFQTDASFEGGTVDMHYNYNSHISAYVDGEKTEIRELPDKTGMQISVPAGEHTVKVKYEDRFLLNLIIDLTSFTLICVAIALIRKRRRKPDAD